MNVINVLDHGYVILVDWMGDDTAIGQAARCSYDEMEKAGVGPDSDARLIKRLYWDGHTSPFEMVEFKFQVKMPIFVARQWVRHRTWNLNEFSGRYKKMPFEMYLPDVDTIGIQSPTNKQCRTIPETVELPGLGEFPYDSTTARAARAYSVEQVRKKGEECYGLYEALLANGWPRELARIILPLNTYTKMVMKVDLHNLLHFISLRDALDAQHEIRVFAQAICDHIKAVVPAGFTAWERRTKAWRKFVETFDPDADY